MDTGNVTATSSEDNIRQTVYYQNPPMFLGYQLAYFYYPFQQNGANWNTASHPYHFINNSCYYPVHSPNYQQVWVPCRTPATFLQETPFGFGKGSNQKGPYNGEIGGSSTAAPDASPNLRYMFRPHDLSEVVGGTQNPHQKNLTDGSSGHSKVSEITQDFHNPTPTRTGPLSVNQSEPQSNYPRSHLSSRKSSKHICMVCFKKFSCSQGLSNHMICHKPIDNYECPTCHDMFKSYSSLYMHLVTHNPPYKCSECAMRFPRPWLLRRHLQNECPSVKSNSPPKT